MVVINGLNGNAFYTHLACTMVPEMRIMSIES